MRKTLILVAAMLVIAISQAFSAPNLYVNGSSSAYSPLTSSNVDLALQADDERVEFTLINESTSYNNRNSLFLHNFNSNSIYRTIFDDNESAGATHAFDLDGTYGFSLLSDNNDNGNYNSNSDKWLFSNREFTRPNSMSDDNYQFFRAYTTGQFGNANYRFENGNIQFSGDYDFLLFIDDRQDGANNYDHNDMIVGGRFVTTGDNNNGTPGNIPEPTTIVLLGAGLAAIGAVRRKFGK